MKNACYKQLFINILYQDTSSKTLVNKERTLRLCLKIPEESLSSVSFRFTFICNAYVVVVSVFVEPHFVDT